MINRLEIEVVPPTAAYTNYVVIAYDRPNKKIGILDTLFNRPPSDVELSQHVGSLEKVMGTIK